MEVRLAGQKLWQQQPRFAGIQLLTLTDGTVIGKSRRPGWHEAALLASA